MGNIDNSRLELKYVTEISGKFLVERYQRGYRWGKDDVKRLLGDLCRHTEEEKQYSLQPIVVKRLNEDKEEDWELIDGQQRLTTLFLLLSYFKKSGLKGVDLSYTIQYKTREYSKEYLDNPDEGKKDDNIDNFHIYQASQCIEECFKGKDEIKDKLYIALQEKVSVLWYEAPSNTDPATLFTRLNVGKIPLNDAELVKALLLSKMSDGSRASEIAVEWDRIERDMRNPNLWAFVTIRNPDDFPTRITFLLDTMVYTWHKYQKEPPRYFTFEKIREKIEKEKNGAESVWEELVNLYGLILGWYENRDLYHKIGYLVSVGKDFKKLVSEGKDRLKSKLEDWLNKQIKDNLDLTKEDFWKLDYEDSREKCNKVLKLMNIETIRKLENSEERYPFRLHQGTSWSLEHIHAQNAQELTNPNQMECWLEAHKTFLKKIFSNKKDDLIKKIDSAVKVGINEETFNELAEKIIECSTETGEPLFESQDIDNLALLPRDANSKLSNAVFGVKRQRILELDRKGYYIPICTRRVFLKYYTEAEDQQLYFWSNKDREKYSEEMKEIISPYLKSQGSSK